MRKLILFTLFFSTVSITFAKRNPLPYCFEGHHTDTSALIWCIVKDKNFNPTTFSYSSENQTPKAIQGNWNHYGKYHYGHFDIKNLSPHQSYQINYQGEKLFNFQTRNPNKTSTTFLLGSCAMMTFRWYWILRPKIKYPIFDAMSAIPNDAMLWMGDNIYLLFRESLSDKKQVQKYIRTRRVPQLAHFLSSTPQYTIWDDHDFGPNNSDGSFAKKDISLKNFQQFWANPQPVDSSQGIYYSVHYPQADVFMTDNRYLAQREKNYFSTSQMQWLLEGLKSSTAPFKIIVTGNQAYNPLSKAESLEKTKEFDTILQYIKENKIEGVFFINGDRHHSEAQRHQFEGMYPIYEFTNSPLSSIPIGVGKKTAEYHHPDRIQGVNAVQNFGKIDIQLINSSTDEYQCTFSTYSKKGKFLWEVKFNSKELSWK
ncbi:MAG: alkaline phosphatase family protein [Chitinophagales bacterium]|nr:alkaline phosphatase family protein [Chitinophagales bacterium]